MNERRMWKVDSMLLREAYNNIFAPCSSYYDIGKEVGKRMAIDYKKEWETLQHIYGKYTIQDKRGIPSIPTYLGEVMNFQIQYTIMAREKLMEEYIRERIIDTNIVGGNKVFHDVQIMDKRHHTVICTRAIKKVDFDAWCKKKERR